MNGSCWSIDGRGWGKGPIDGSLARLVHDQARALTPVSSFGLEPPDELVVETVGFTLETVGTARAVSSIGLACQCCDCCGLWAVRPPVFWALGAANALSACLRDTLDKGFCSLSFSASGEYLAAIGMPSPALAGPRPIRCVAPHVSIHGTPRVIACGCPGGWTLSYFKRSGFKSPRREVVRSSASAGTVYHRLGGLCVAYPCG